MAHKLDSQHSPPSSADVTGSHAVTSSVSAGKAEALPHGRPCIASAAALALSELSGPDKNHPGISSTQHLPSIGGRTCEDIERNVQICTAAVELASEPDAKIEALRVLAHAYNERYRHTWALEDLSARIETLRSAIEASITPHLELLLELCEALSYQYLRHLDGKDLDEWIYLARAALGSLPHQPAMQVQAALTLGSALRARYERFRDQDALSTAINLHEIAHSFALQNGLPAALSKCELALSLHSTFDETSDVETGSRVIEYHRTLLNAHSADIEDTAAAFHNLGNSIGTLCQCLPSESAMSEAQSWLGKAAALRPPGHPYRHTTLNTLATLKRRTSDIDLAITMCHEVLSLRPEGHPQRPETLILLASLYYNRLTRDTVQQDFVTSCEYAQQAYDQRPRHPSVLSNLGSILANYGAIMGNRYAESEDISSLDTAIEAYRDSLDNISLRHPWRPLLIINLAHELRVRFSHSHDGYDIAEAISIQREALAYQLPGQPGYNRLVQGLASTYRAHFEDGNTETSIDPDEVIRLIKSTKVETAQNVTMGLELRAQLIYAYRIRFQVCKDLISLDESINLCRQIQMEPTLPKAYLHNATVALAANLRHRFDFLEDVKNAEESRDLLQQVLPIYQTQEPAASITIWDHLVHLYLNPQAPFHSLEVALSYLIQSLKMQDCNPWRRLQKALLALGKIYDMADKLSVGSLRRVLEVYQLAMELLPRIAYFGLGRLSQLKALHKVDSCAVAAARSAIAVGEANIALELLEEGRAVFWQQYLRLRTDTEFDDLPGRLASPLREASLLLEQVPDEHADRRSHEASVILRRQAGERFRGLLEEARSLPGFERLLLPNRYEAIKLAAVQGPVIVLIAGKTVSHVVVVSADRPDGQLISLPGVGNDELSRYHAAVTKMDSTIRRRNAKPTKPMIRAIRMRSGDNCYAITTILDRLWARVLSPIVQHLGIETASGRARTRLFICPTGAFVNLPVHAASTPTGFGLASFMVPTYTPTISALMSARRAFHPVRREDIQLLLAAAPFPSARPPLVAAVQEVHIIRSIVPEHSIYPTRMAAGSPRTKQTSAAELLAHLPHSSLLHCACHGFQEPNNPLESGLVLQDRVVRMSELMELRLSQAFLAVLSACETAKGDRDQPDQTVNLASALLFAGFKSVIGTMWPMGDTDGPILAETIYEALFAGDAEYLDPTSVPYALGEAVEQLRQRKVHPSRWAPFVHVGI